MQNATKYTPGPWSYTADLLSPGKYTIYGWGPIARCGNTTAIPNDGEHNARLIAAAPELLEACRAFMKCLAPDGTTCAPNHADFELAQSAINKAIGRTTTPNEGE